MRPGIRGAKRRMPGVRWVSPQERGGRRPACGIGQRFPRIAVLWKGRSCAWAEPPAETVIVISTATITIIVIVAISRLVFSGAKKKKEKKPKQTSWFRIHQGGRSIGPRDTLLPRA